MFALTETPGTNHETEDPLYVIFHGELGSSPSLQLGKHGWHNGARWQDNVRHDLFSLEEDIGKFVSLEVVKEGTDDWKASMIEISHSNLEHGALNTYEFKNVCVTGSTHRLQLFV